MTIGYIGIILSVLLVLLFFVGIGFSAKHSFKSGIYFFVILIIHQVYAFFSPPVIRNYIDERNAERQELMLGLSNVEFVMLSSFISNALLFVAFLVLVFGLRNLLRSRN